MYSLNKTHDETESRVADEPGENEDSIHPDEVVSRGASSEQEDEDQPESMRKNRAFYMGKRGF